MSDPRMQVMLDATKDFAEHRNRNFEARRQAERDAERWRGRSEKAEQRHADLIAKLRERHKPTCMNTYCGECGHWWPCMTIRILDDAEQEQGE